MKLFKTRKPQLEVGQDIYLKSPYEITKVKVIKINIVIDVYPSSKRFRNLYNKNNRSYEYDNLEKCLKKEFNIK